MDGKKPGNAEPQLVVGRRERAELGLSVLPGLLLLLLLLLFGVPVATCRILRRGRKCSRSPFAWRIRCRSQSWRNWNTSWRIFRKTSRVWNVGRKSINGWMRGWVVVRCGTRHPALAQVVQDSLFRFDGERYKLLAWCIMPNHVHVLIRPEAGLGKIVQSWKSYTGRWALAHNAELGLGVPGNSPGKAFWMREYWDRYIRDKKHYEAVVDYIHNNPVKAGLCKVMEQWRWSSKWGKA